MKITSDILKLVTLRNGNTAYKLIDSWLKQSSYDDIKVLCKYKPSFKFYELKYTDLKVENYENTKINLAMHGTSIKKAEKILERGLFLNSSSGYFGSGVYNTHCADLAFYFSRKKDYKKSEKKWSAIIISEVRFDEEPVENIYYKSYWHKQKLDPEIKKKQIRTSRKFKKSLRQSSRIQLG